MESHGIKSSKKRTIAVIPARLASSRLAGKLLLPLAGEPIIVKTARQASAASSIDQVVVATDDQRIADVVNAAGFEAVITASYHLTGSDRIAEAIAGREVDVIVNVQGDEPLISPETIDRAVVALIESNADFATTCEDITRAEDVLNPNVVKLVVDGDGFALYFSRSPIPYPRNEVSKHGSIGEALLREPDLISSFKKHTGLYVFTPDGLRSFIGMPQSPLEITESLEQLRILEAGYRIKVVIGAGESLGIDTEQDYQRARKLVGDC